MPDAPGWVLDTNVVVSGLLVPAGPPGRLVDMVLARQLRLSFDDRIEAEYREVLARPRFHLDPTRVAAVVAILQFQEALTAGPWIGAAPPDPDDAMFLEVARDSRDRLLVTGNLRHYPAACRGPVTVVSPRQAWDRFIALTAQE